MKTIELTLYKFDELSAEAKQTAIEKVRESYYAHNDFANWAIDDCALLEPLHKELEDLFGKDYNFPLIKNNRKNIYFNTDRSSFLDCAEAMEITNSIHFLKWLGIPDEFIFDDEFDYRIFTPPFRNSSTTIDFDGFSSEYGDVIDSAVEKFNNHIDDCLRRIRADIDYRFTDEAIQEDIEGNDYDFLENGEIY